MLLLAAALLWSLSGVLLKAPPLAELPAENRGMILAFYRAVFASLFLVPFVRRRHVRFHWLLIPMSLLFALMNVLFVTAMTRTTAAAAIFLQYTSVVWASGFAWLFLKERIDRRGVVALACTVCGIGWIVVGDWQGANFTGNLIALASGLSYAGVIVFLRCLRHENSGWLIALNHVVSVAVLLPWVLGMPVDLRADQWLLIALAGIVQMAIPYVLFARAIRHVRTYEAALIPLLEPILNPVWVWLFWREEVGESVFVGGAFIVGGLAARYLLFSERSQPE